MKCCTKLETAKARCPIVFQGHPSNFKVTWDKTSPILTQIGRFRIIGQSQLSNPSDLPCLRSYVKFQGYTGQKKKQKKSTILTQIESFWTVTPVWIHRQLWNDACTGYDNKAYVNYMDLAVRCSRKAVKLNHSPYEMMHKDWRGIEEVPCSFWRSSVRSHGVPKNGQFGSWFEHFWTITLFSCDQAALKMVFSICLSVRLSVRLSVHLSHLFIRPLEKRTYYAVAMSVRPSIRVLKWCTQLDIAQKRCPIVFQGHPSNFKVTRL